MDQNTINVEPHQITNRKPQHTDIAQTSLYGTSVSIMNSERSAVWQRYSAMLIANTIVFGFLGRQGADNFIFVIGGSCLGLALCFCWWILTEDGWRFFTLYSKVSTRFSWPLIGENVNSCKVMYDEFSNMMSEGRFKILNRFNNGDRIKTVALLVILLFVLFYLYSLGLSLWTAFK